MISVFVFTKWGVKHGNVIYKFVTDNNNIIPFHYFTNSKTKQMLTNDCFSPLNAYRNLFEKKVWKSPYSSKIPFENYSKSSKV